MMNNVMCVKWGDLYGPEYVNILYAMVKRNLTAPFRFICFTEDATGIRDEVEVKPLPKKKLEGWWVKLAFFQNLPDVEGPCLTFDLDMVIYNSIDCYFDYKPGTFVMKWDYADGKKRHHKKPIQHGNSSCVMRFEANQHTHILDAFNINKVDCGIHNTKGDFKKHKYWGDQVWITEYAGNDVQLWPEEWIVKFSRDCHCFRGTTEPVGEFSIMKNGGLGQFDFSAPREGNVIAFSGIHFRNENELKKIGKWWHSKDL